MSEVSCIRLCLYATSAVGLTIILFGALIVPVLPHAQADQIITAVPEVKKLEVEDQLVQALAAGSAIRFVAACILGLPLVVSAGIGLRSVRRIERNLAPSTTIES